MGTAQRLTTHGTGKGKNAMDIAALAQKIIKPTQTMSRGTAAIYLADQIRLQQLSLNQIVSKSAKPKGWTLALHEELIHALVTAENDLRNRRVAA